MLQMVKAGTDTLDFERQSLRKYVEIAQTHPIRLILAEAGAKDCQWLCRSMDSLGQVRAKQFRCGFWYR
jgi:hypothetical protein